MAFVPDQHSQDHWKVAMARVKEVWRIYLMIGVSFLIVSGLIGYGYLVGDQMYFIRSPLYNTLEEIELEASRIRLRMDEVVAGLRKQEDDQIFNHMENSLLYLVSLSRAENYVLIESNPSRIPNITASIERLQSFLSTWKNILSRFNSQEPRYGHPAELRAEIAASFSDFSAAISEIEALISSTVERSRRHFQVVQALSIGVAVLLAAAATMSTIRYRRQRRRGFEQLERTRSELQNELSHRRKAERSLAASEQLIRIIFENSPVAVVVTRLTDSRIVNVNEAFVEATGYARTEVLGRTFRDIPIWESPVDRESVLQQLTLSRQVRDLEFQFRMKDGRIRAFLLSANVVDIEGEAHILASARDITERKHAAAKAAWLASFPELNPYPVVEVDLDGRLHYLNPAAENMFPGLSQQGAGHAWLADWEAVTNPFRTGAAKTAVREVLFAGSWYHQAMIWLEKTRRVRTYGLDITVRKHAEEAQKTSHDALETWVGERTQQLQVANLRLKSEVEERLRTEGSLIKHQQQLRRLSSALVQTEERERRRISTALHDGIAQTLAAAKIKLGAIRSSLAAGETARQVDETRDLISAAIKETRSLTFELSLPVLYEIGLKPALEWLAEQFNKKFGLQISVDGDGCEQGLEIPERVFLFQALRELCFNVVKHARATHATVSIRREQDPGGIRCDIADNGIGFNAKQGTQRPDGEMGFGLFSIREQLRQYGGTFTLETNPGCGTRVVLRLPSRIENPCEGGGRHEDPGAPGG